MHLLSAVARAAAAVLIAAGFLYVAYVAGTRYRSSRGILTRWLGVVAALLWLPTAVFHLLAVLRLFSPIPALVAIAVLAVLAYYVSGGAGRLRHELARDRLFVRRVAALLRNSPYRGTVVAFLVCAAPGLLRALVLPPLGWDTLTYHGVKAGMWVQNGGVDSMIGTGPWGYYRNMLAGGEVFPAWAMLPLRADVLAPAIDVLQWLALGFVLIVLGRRLFIREPYASIAAGFVLAIPTVKLMVGSGYVEPALLLGVLAGLTLGLAGWNAKGGAALVLGAGALGVAAATKISTIPLSGAIALLLFVRAITTRRYAVLALSMAAFSVAVAPWMLRTMVRTGLPFSPVPVKVAGIALGEPSPELKWFMDRPTLRPYALEDELAALKRVFPPPGSQTEALGLLAAVPLALSFVGFPRLARRSRAGLVLIAVAILASLASYYAPQFTMIRHYWSASSSRFLLPMVGLLTLVSVCWCRPASRASRMYLGFLRVATFINLLAYSLTGFSPLSIQAVCLLLAGLTALALLATALPNAGVKAAVAVVAVVALGLLRAQYRHELFTHDFALHALPKYWTVAIPFVDDPDVPRRIAITSGPHQNVDNWFAAPFMGQALQNELVYEPVSMDGTLVPLGTDEFVRTASFEAWKQRLHDRRITDVMSFTPPSIELGWMHAHPEVFEKLCGGSEWGLFRVR